MEVSYADNGRRGVEEKVGIWRETMAGIKRSYLSS